MTDYTIPAVLRPSTLAERKAESLIRDANNPKGDFHGLVSAGVDEVVIEDRRGRFAGTRLIETFVDKRSGKKVAQRHEDGAIYWLAADAPPKATPEPAAIIRKRRYRDPDAPKSMQILSVATIDQRTRRIVETEPEQ